MSEEPQRHLAHTLMPLKLAAELIFSKVYAERSVGRREDMLDSIATTIAVLAPIYEYGLDSHQLPRALSRSDLEGGMFKGGALRLQFIDGRQPRTSLAVSADDVSATLNLLLNQQSGASK